MSTTTKTTKQGNLSSTFKGAAVVDGDGALAFMLMAAFGLSLSTAMALAERMMTDKDASAIVLCMAATVQIRNHVVFVGADHQAFKKKYPELIIDGSRDQADQFNYGGLRAVGFALAHVTSDQIGDKIIGKAGSAITGERTNESDAGKINKEASLAWTAVDRLAFPGWVTTAKAAHGADLDLIVAGFAAKATTFGKVLTAEATVRPAVKPPASKAAAPPPTTVG